MPKRPLIDPPPSALTRITLLLPVWILACSGDPGGAPEPHGRTHALALNPDSTAAAKLAERENLRREIDDVKRRASELRESGAPHTRVDELQESVVDLHRKLTSLEGRPAPLAAHPDDRSVASPQPSALSQAVIDAYLREKPKYDLSKAGDVAALAALKRRMLGK